jgi:hypothetical protein
MACPYINRNGKLYKELEKDFGWRDAYRIAYRTTQNKFSSWYGKAKRDEDGMPIQRNGTFINDRNEAYEISNALYPKEEERKLWKLGSQTKWEGRKDVPSELSKAQWVHVRTKAFADWFGNWRNDSQVSSKVINSKTGEPLEVYAKRINENGDLVFSSVNTDNNPVFLSIKNDEEGAVDFANDEFTVRNYTQIKSALANNGQYTIGSRDMYKSQLELTESEQMRYAINQAAELKEIFKGKGLDVEITMDSTLKENANVQYLGNGKAIITLNPKKVFKDTVPHEFAHLFIDMLGYNSPEVREAIAEAKKADPELWKLIQRKYPVTENYSKEEQEKELLVTVMGVEGSLLFKGDGKAQAKWKYIVNKLFRVLMRKLGLTKYNAQELYLDMALDVFSGGTIENLEQDKVSMSLLDDLDKNQKVVLEKDPITKKGVYKNVEDPTAKYGRGTEWLASRFSWEQIKRDDQNISFAEERAIEDFKYRNLDKNTDKIKITVGKKDIELSFNDYVALKQIGYNTQTDQGTISHLIMEKIINAENGIDTSAIEREIEELSTEIPGVRQATPPHYFRWLYAAAPTVFRKIGLNIYDNIDIKDKDKMRSEVVVSDKEISVATSIDSVVEHSDGTITLLDWKSGKYFISDAIREDKMMRYAEGIEGYDTKLGRAKLEMTLRALLLKRQYPDVKFRSVDIVHLDRIRGHKSYGADLQINLPILKAYFKETNLTLHDKLLKEGLFNPTNYYATNLQYGKRSKYADMTREQKIAAMEADLFKYSNIERPSPAVKDEIKKLTKELLELSKDEGKHIKLENVEDITKIERWIGNRYDKMNPYVQAFIKKHLMPGKKKVQKDMEAFRERHRAALLPLIKEHYASKNRKFNENQIDSELTTALSYVGAWAGTVGGLAVGMPGIGGTIGTQAGGYLGATNKMGINYMELYSDMFKEYHGGEKEGYYLKTDPAEIAKLSPAKQEYIKFFQKEMRDQYAKTMATEVYVESTGKVMKMWELLEKPEVLPADFIPRVPMQDKEIGERYNNDLQGFWKSTRHKLTYLTKKNFTTYEHDHSISSVGYSGVPFKYWGSPATKASRDHTLNMELMLESFMNNLITKEHMDYVYGLGQGIITVLEGEKDTKGGTYENTIKYIKDVMLDQVLGQKKDDLAKTNRLKIPRMVYKNGRLTRVPGESHYISIAKVMGGLKNIVSAITMWVSLVGGTANGILITMLTVKDGMKNSLAKRFGVPPGELDFTLSDLVAAQKEVITYWKDSFTGNTKNNKTWLMMKETNFLPSNYDHMVKDGELLTTKNKVFEISRMFGFHAIPEEWGQQILLVAQLKRMKVSQEEGAPSMWDSYKVEDGKLVWKGGTRMKRRTSTGEIEEIQGLTIEEENRLKRITARIHGGYRNEEKVMLELTALGKWALQFKKYLPAIYNNALSGRYEDESLGRWEKKEVDKETGEDIYEWVARTNEGRIHVARKWAMHAIAAKLGSGESFQEYAYSKMDAEEKKNFISVINSFTWWIAMGLILGAAFDDDDEDNPWLFRLERIQQDMSQDFNAIDWMRALKEPTVTVPKFYKLLDGTVDFVWKGVIQGKKVKRGENRGDYVGLGTMRANAPIINRKEQYENYKIRKFLGMEP